MRKFSLILCLLSVILLFNSCGSTGASSLPELANMVVKALNSRDSTKIWKTTPTESQMEAALKAYFSNEYKTPEDLHKLAFDRSVNNQVSLIKDLEKVKEAGRQAGISWSKVKLANFSFNENETVDAYKKAAVSVTISGGTPLYNTLLFNAVQYDGRWYVYNGALRWQVKK